MTMETESMSKIQVRKANVEGAPHLTIYYCKPISFYASTYHTWTMHKWTRHAIKIKICAIREYKRDGQKMIEGMYD